METKDSGIHGRADLFFPHANFALFVFFQLNSLLFGNLSKK